MQRCNGAADENKGPVTGLCALERIKRAEHSAPSLVEHMRVNHGGAHIRMAEQLLHRSNVVARLQQMGGKRVAQHMRAHRLGDLRSPRSLPNRPLHRLGVHMVAPLHRLARTRIGARIHRPHRRRKHVLPRPAAVGVRVLHRQCMGQIHPPQPRLQVFFMQRPCTLQLSLQICDQVFRQHRHPILVALALANQYLAPRKLHILHPQAQRLQQPHTRAIQQPRNQARGALHVHEQLAHLCRRQHHRQPLGRLGLHHLIQPRQLHLQHLFVKVQNRRFGLVLRRCRHLPVYRQVGQKGSHLRRTHLRRVPLIMKQDEAAHPIQIRRLGANAVMPRTQMVAHTVQQLGRLRRNRHRRPHRGFFPIGVHPENFRFAYKGCP